MVAYVRKRLSFRSPVHWATRIDVSVHRSVEADITPFAPAKSAYHSFSKKYIAGPRPCKHFSDAFFHLLFFSRFRSQYFFHSIQIPRPRPFIVTSIDTFLTSDSIRNNISHEIMRIVYGRVTEIERSRIFVDRNFSFDAKIISYPDP